MSDVSSLRAQAAARRAAREAELTRIVDLVAGVWVDVATVHAALGYPGNEVRTRQRLRALVTTGRVRVERRKSSDGLPRHHYTAQT